MLIVLYHYSSSRENRAREDLVRRLREANQLKTSDRVRAYEMYVAILKEAEDLGADDKVTLSAVLQKARADRDELRQAVGKQIERRREDVAIQARREPQRVEEQRTQRLSQAVDSVTAVLMLFLIIAIAVFLYLFPAIIALTRGHHNRAAILVVNLFLGWSFLGWVIALAWAFTKVEKS